MFYCTRPFFDKPRLQCVLLELMAMDYALNRWHSKELLEFYHHY